MRIDEEAAALPAEVARGLPDSYVQLIEGVARGAPDDELAAIADVEPAALPATVRLALAKLVEQVANRATSPRPRPADP